MGSRPLAVAFCHPDLGLGGAERLVVDAACELAAAGHSVDMYTAHHDRSRCFQETLDGAFSVTVAGAWFPRAVYNRAHAFCAYVRCILIALHIAWVALRRRRQYDVVFVDQVSAAVPVFLLLMRSKVLFYCHFPDQLLTRRRSALHAAYRTVLDACEESSTGQAHEILVNSAFTQGVFLQTFARLRRRGVLPRVLHPAVQPPSEGELLRAAASWRGELGADLAAALAGRRVLLSINRFERKKDLGLAVRAFRELLDMHLAGAKNGSAGARCTLVLAGGYDARLAENRDHFAEIQALVRELGLQDQVHLLRSFSDAQRTALLAAAAAVVYTPPNEHFGIVPLEAMAAGRPVIACNSGGPTESVVHGVTGFLCEPQPAAFAAAMAKLVLDPQLAARLGAQARQHVQQSFSRAAFGEKLDAIVRSLANGSRAE